MNIKQIKGVVLVSLQLEELDKEELKRRGDLREMAMDTMRSIVNPDIVSDTILETDRDTLQLALLLTNIPTRSVTK